MTDKTELQRAIEFLAEWPFNSKGLVEYQQSVEIIRSAAKQLEAVTKERDEYHGLLYGCDKHKLWNGLSCIGCIEQERDTLKSDYKQALEALEENVWPTATGTQESFDKAKRVLQLPSAITIMKGSRANEQ